MALETLIDSQSAAAEIMNIDYAEMKELQEPELVMIGSVAIAGQEVAAYRAHSGDRNRYGRIAKGGIRIFSAYRSDAEARATVKELAIEMHSKLGLRGLGETYKGGKGLIVADSRLPFGERVKIIQQYEHLMESAGLAGPDRDVPAGDIGTNGLSDAYALEYRKRQPEDRRWQAVITGKSPENGGLESRSSATGWGTYTAQLALMESKGHDFVRSAVQGFGNVGGWHAYYASNDPEQRIRINAISDAVGTLITPDERGLIITKEIVEEIADNPTFSGDKIQVLAAKVEQNQPGIELKIYPAAAILEYPTDYFVPAAMGNVITYRNVGHLGAMLAVIEAANGPTTKSAHHYLLKHGLQVMPDIVANGAGVDCSVMERDANIINADSDMLFVPSTADIQQALAQTSTRLVREVLAASENLQTPDLRIGAAAISMGHLLARTHPHLLDELLG